MAKITETTRILQVTAGTLLTLPASMVMAAHGVGIVEVVALTLLAAAGGAFLWQASQP